MGMTRKEARDLMIKFELVHPGIIAALKVGRRQNALKRTDGVSLGDSDVHAFVERSGGFTTVTLADMDDGDVVVLSEDAVAHFVSLVKDQREEP